MAILRPFLAAALLAAGFSLPVLPPAHAHSYAAGDLKIGHPWSRPSIGTSRPGVAYLSISNSGAAPDRLIAASSPWADRVELHESRMESGRMTMVEVKTLSVPAGGKVLLAPRGYHLMLMGLRRPLNEGETFPLTLTFEHAGKIEVEVKVEPMNKDMSRHGGHDGHHGNGGNDGVMPGGMDHGMDHGMVHGTGPGTGGGSRPMEGMGGHP